MEVGVSMTLSHHVNDNRGSPDHKSTTPHVQLSPQKNNHNKYEEHGAVSQVSSVLLYGVPIVSLVIDRQERLCLAQISNTLLKEFSYNEIHNRRVALGITCVQCTPVQLEILRRAGAMPISSRRCGMITKREAERLCKSFLGDNSPPKLPDHFAFEVFHECAWGCRGSFVPSRYNSSRAKCIKCTFCNLFFSPNKFIFHSHRLPDSKYVQPDAANFNSWRRHMKLSGTPPEEVVHAWEDVKAMFNGGTRKRMLSTSSPNSSAPQPPPKAPKVSNSETRSHYTASKNKNALTLPAPPPPPAPPRAEMSPYGQPLPPSPSAAMSPRVPPIPSYPEKPPIQHPYDLHRSFVDYVWSHQPASPQHKPFHFAPYSLPWLKRPLLAFGPAAVAAAAAVASETGLPEAPPLTPLSQAQPASAAAAAAAAAAALSHHLYTSAFRPVGQLKVGSSTPPPPLQESGPAPSDEEEETVDIETTEDDTPAWVIPPRSTTPTPRSPSPGLPPSANQLRESPDASKLVENGGPTTPPGYDERPISPRSVSPRRPLSPEPPRRVVSPEQRGAWVRVSQQDQRRHQQHAQYRHEVARQLHIMRELAASPEHTAPQQREILRELAAERRARLNVQTGRIKDAQSALHHLSNKMALDCSSCHAYQESNISP